MCMLDEIRAKRDEIYAIARKHKAEKLWVFGSCARKEERPDSDVDFLVEYAPKYNLFDAIDLKDDMERVLGREVDVVSYGCIDNERSPWFAKEVRRDMVSV
ncbi:MAG: nucleotidyltransferase family protein [Kiritimatiellae bacterium]|nr:nucleotidyltransferase family protein [Kiritimatiellia bacterium]